MSHLPVSLALLISIVAGLTLVSALTGIAHNDMSDDAQARCAISFWFQDSGRCFWTFGWESSH